MPDNSPQDGNLDDHDKNYFRGLIDEGLGVTAMAKRSGWSRATIYRRFAEWGWKPHRGWIETDSPANGPPAANNHPATAPPTDASRHLPTTKPGDLLTPEVRAKVEKMKKKRRKP